jgi:hypothetical protein
VGKGVGEGTGESAGVCVFMMYLPRTEIQRMSLSALPS